MGKINYTLLNASALNASRLNMTGETGKPGGGAGGYWPDGTPAAIRRSAVLWYDIAKQGATNETMAANPVLKDLSGHGHDATCYNFGWGGMSGVGGYPITFHLISRDTVAAGAFENINPYTSIFTRCGTGASDNVYDVSDTNRMIKVRISGITGSGILVKWTGGSYENDITIADTDGIWELHCDPEQPNGTRIGLKVYSDEPKNCNITIELLPQYPGALVSDGVDDYVMVEGLPIIQSLIINANVDALPQREGKWAYLYDSTILGVDKNRFYATFSYLGDFVADPNLIDGYSEQEGESSYEGQQHFCLFASYKNRNDFGAMVFYSLLLFSRKLTPEEIEWVKNNLIENNTEA